VKNFLKVIMMIMVASLNYGQAPDIVHLPTQNHNQSISESTPVVLSGSEILVFYASEDKDTIYSTRSTDAGINWQEQRFIISGYNLFNTSNNPIYLSAQRTSTGRILLSWTKWLGGILIIYSDDNGYTWSDAKLILGGGGVTPLQRKSLYNPHINILKNNKLVLSFNTNTGSLVYYRVSVDNGETWSEEAFEYYNYQGSTKFIRDVSFFSIDEQTQLAVFEYNEGADWGIYKKVSTDGGQIWSDEMLVINSSANEIRPRILKSLDEKLWLIYQVEDTLHFNQDAFIIQNDIFFSISNDSGETWIKPERLTSYIAEDYFINGTILGDEPLITFSSQRFTNRDQISFAIPGKTVEVFRPPFIADVWVETGEASKLENFIISRIIDDNKIETAKVFIDNIVEIELFDDGKHNDGDSADYVYANKLLQEDLLPSTTAYMNSNNIIFPLNNKGTLADTKGVFNFNARFEATDIDNNTTEFLTSLTTEYTSFSWFDNNTFLFSGGFMISGYTDNLLWANGQASSSMIQNYLPGRVGEEPDNINNLVYIIRASDPAFGYSWQLWRDAVELGADFYDGDGDGVYNPIDKNYNQIWDLNEDMPDLLGDETTWCVYNDGVPANERARFEGIGPQGIEIHQTLFAADKPGLENIIFIRYKIINKGTMVEELDSVIFSFWSDPDIGDFNDDLVGSDTLLNSSFCYNDGEDNDYGENPPAFFTTLLQGPIAASSDSDDIAYNRKGPHLGVEKFAGYNNKNISAFIHYQSSDPLRGDPNTEFEARMYSSGLNKSGLELDPCNDNIGEVMGGIDCSAVNPLFWYSGDPVEGVGWINNHPSDQMAMLSVGEFTLEKDKPVTIIGAYILGRGTDALNSITVARSNVQKAIEEYDNNFNSLAYNPGKPNFPVTDYILYQNYPNPFNPTTTIRYEIPQQGFVTLKIYDILGEEIISLINEEKPAGRYEVDFSPKRLASGVYLYRIKVNDFVTSKKMVLLR